MEPLHISDPKLNKKIQRAITDLERFYPDRVVAGLEKEHKGLANRLGEAAKEAGYPSRRELMEAYGFTLAPRASAGAAGGRPVTTDANEVFIELRHRYQSQPLPKTLSILVEENPDLAGKLKTLGNKSNQLFGTTLTEVLIEERLLDATPKARKSEIARKQVEAMIEDLQEYYACSQDRPRKIKDLEAAHPEYADEIAALISNSKQWFGMTPRKYLINVGVFPKGQADIDHASAEAAIDELVTMFADRSDSEKPASIKELVSLVPEYEAQIAARRRSWNATSNITFVEMLRQRGILRQTEAEKKRIRLETAKRFVRNATLDELVDVWKRAGGAFVLSSEDRTPMLPERVLGIDLDALVELRETTLCVSVGRHVELQVGLSFSYSAQGLSVHFEDAAGDVCFSANYWDLADNAYREIAACSSDKGSASVLFGQIGAKVVSVSDAPDGSRFVQVNVRYLYPLSEQSMLNLLVRAGLMTDEDLLGGDAWRSRDFSTVGLPAPYTQMAESAPSHTLDDDGADDPGLPEDASAVIDAPDSPTVVEVPDSPAAAATDSPAAGEPDSPSEVDPPNAPDSDREAKIAILMTAALTGAMASGGFPEDVVGELMRAADGDQTVDVDDLARRVNELLPSTHAVDPAAWTFDQGLRASTPHISIAVPDGYRVLKGYTEQGLFEFERPFVAVPANVPDKDIPNCERIIAVDGSELHSNSELADMYANYGIDEFIVAMKRYTAYCSDVESMPETIHEQLVEGANGQVYLRVISDSAEDGFECYLTPCALGAPDWLRITFYNTPLEEEPRYRPYIEKLASTLKIESRERCRILRDFDRCRAERVDAEFFEATIADLYKVLGVCRTNENQANLSKAQKNADSFTPADAIAVVVEGMSPLVESEFVYCEQAFEALKRQVELGAPTGDLERMLDTVKGFHGSFEVNVEADGNPEAERALRSSGGIRLPSRYAEVAAEIEAFSARYFAGDGHGQSEREVVADMGESLVKETPEEREARIKLMIIDSVADSKKTKNAILDEVLADEANGRFERALEKSEVERCFSELYNQEKLSYVRGIQQSYSSFGMVDERYRWHLEHVGAIPDDVKAMNGFERAKLAHEEVMRQYESIVSNLTRKWISHVFSGEDEIVDTLLKYGGGITRDVMIREAAKVPNSQGSPGPAAIENALWGLKSRKIVVEMGDLYYLWTQHGVDGQPMKDDFGLVNEIEKLLKERDSLESEAATVGTVSADVVKQTKNVEALESKVSSFGFFGGGAEKRKAKADLKQAKVRLAELQAKLASAEATKARLEQCERAIEENLSVLESNKSKYRWY